MLSIGLLFLVTIAVESLVLTPQSNLFPENAQDSMDEDTTLETIAAESLQNSSLFATTTLSPLPITDSSPALSTGTSGAMYRCDADLGVNLDGGSCTDALRTINFTDTKQSLWGLRGLGIGYDFPVPRRWVSPDGNCIIETILFKGTSAVASLADVAGGAATVIHQCIQNAKANKGGFSKEFGGDNKLGVYVALPMESPTNVRCYGSAAAAAILESCQSILDKMDVSNLRTVFGRSGTAGPHVELPYTWQSDDHKCIMRLRSAAQSDLYSWAKVWEAASMATAMCIAQEKKAFFSQLGWNKKLFLEVAAEGVGDDDVS